MDAHLNLGGFNYILDFKSISNDMLPKVGGKNYSLGELVNAGFRVPPGFAVTTDAYLKHIEENKLDGMIKEVLNTEKDPKKAGITIRKAIEDKPMPEDVREEIESAYHLLCEHLKNYGEAKPSFAVRSSATAEDLPSASFAGQHDTYLWVCGKENVVNSVKKCWGSLFTERAIVYRNSKNIPHERSLMSVCIQKMVNAKAAGVMFTLNPATGSYDTIVIEANWGLGESVVSGIASVDSYIVDKVRLAIKSKNISIKTIQCVVNEKGEVVECEVPRELQNKACLADEEVIELAKQGKLIEKHYGRPMDIEFAIDKNLSFPQNVLILQARPETKWSGAKPKLSANGFISQLTAFFTPK